MLRRVAIALVVAHLVSCVKAPSQNVDAGFIDAGFVDAGFVDAGTLADAGVRAAPFRVGKASCVDKTVASAHARRGGAGNIGFIDGCPAWVDPRILVPKTNGGVGALEHSVTSTQQRAGVDVCCYFGAPPPP